MRKKIFSVLLLVVIAVLLIFMGVFKVPMKTEVVEDETQKVENVVSYDKESVYLWYSDETLTNYLNSAAVAYNESHSIRVVPVLQSPVEYLEAINKSVNESDVPDMYIVSHDSLAKAYSAGLATTITLSEDKFDSLYIGQSKNSVDYKGMLVGYPLYFETSTMIYNETYLRDMAIAALKAEQKEAEGDGLSSSDSGTSSSNGESSENGETAENEEIPFSDEEIAKKIQDILPETIGDIMTLADNYDAPEDMEVFFTWDVNDIFYNYFFVGDAIDVGGEAGWDTSILDIYNEDAIQALEAYQELNQFFSIESSESSYADVINDFIHGKIVFTIATSDVIGTLEQARASEDEDAFKYDYGVMVIPDMTDTLETRTMSVTDCVAISPYSKHMEVANDFALFLTTEFAENLYTKASKISCAGSVGYDYPAIGIFTLEYGYSEPIPKLLETGNFWVDMEKAFLVVWNGGDVNSELRTLAEQMIYQITGDPTELPYIDIHREKEEVVYLDEEEYIASLVDSSVDEDEEE